MIRFCSRLPKTPECRVVAGQVLRSATSVGANYRACCHSRSKADFIAKLAIVEEEADESVYWFELLEELGSVEPREMSRLKDEANQLAAIAVASRKTAKSK